MAPSVLIIDDEEAIAWALRKACERQGFQPFFIFGFEHLQPLFKSQKSHFQLRCQLKIACRFRTGDGGIAELPLEGGEKIERIFAAIGLGDPAFLMVEQSRFGGLGLGVAQFSTFFETKVGAEIDHVSEVDCSQLQAGSQNPVAPLRVKHGVIGDGHHASIVT